MTEKSELNIDEDWKNQVEREKQSEERILEEREDLNVDNLPPPPPANFETLVSGLATQSVAAMGQFDPADTRLDYAKYYIDLLEVLQQKTARNLTGQEHDMLKTVLHQLRLLYVGAQSKSGGNEAS